MPTYSVYISLYMLPCHLPSSLKKAPNLLALLTFINFIWQIFNKIFIINISTNLMCICNGHDDTVSDVSLVTLQQLLELWRGLMWNDFHPAVPSRCRLD